MLRAVPPRPRQRRHIGDGGRGCDICKPTVGSILASCWNQPIMDPSLVPLQDTNDTFMANMQKNGTYSIVPRIAGGEITPDKLITLGVFDPLMTWEDGELVPYLAESMEASEDLTTYTMTLREGVTFHDGTPLNADAVVKHFDRMKDPATGCPCLDTASHVVSVDTPDGPDRRRTAGT